MSTLSLPPLHTTHATVYAPRRPNPKVLANQPRLLTCELSHELATSSSLSFIEALLGDG